MEWCVGDDGLWSLEVAVDGQLNIQAVLRIEETLCDLRTRVDEVLKGPLTRQRSSLSYLHKDDGLSACLTSRVDLPAAAELIVWSSLWRLRKLLKSAASPSMVEGA